LRKSKCILFYSRVSRFVWAVWVGVGSRVLLILGRGGSEGHFPGLMAAAVEREVSVSYLFSFLFDVPSMGHLA
jgi:hypothetical protein